MLQVTAFIRVPLREFEFSYARSSGPGGQNVNKVNSKAVLRWQVSTTQSLPLPVRERFMAAFASRINDEGVFVITSDRFRDQTRNVDDCLEKLKEMLTQVAHPPKNRKATKPTRGSKERRIKAKHKHSDKKKQRREKLF